MLNDKVNEEPHIFQEKKQKQGFIRFLQSSDPICLNLCEKLFNLLSFTSDFTEYRIYLFWGLLWMTGEVIAIGSQYIHEIWTLIK